MAERSIALLCLTGLGNEVLRSLVSTGRSPVIVITRKESGPYPYYDEVNVAEESTRFGIETAFGAQGEKRLHELKPSIILVCTYHRIIKPEVFEPAEYAINFHPSLLPRYRGASPYYWVLRNDEQSTGITAHNLAKEADAGDILLQREVQINEDDTQGSLRKKLARLAGDMTIEMLEQIETGKVSPQSQDESQASYNPRVDDAVRAVRPDWSYAETRNHLRALTPFPKALWQGSEFELGDLDVLWRQLQQTN